MQILEPTPSFSKERGATDFPLDAGLVIKEEFEFRPSIQAQKTLKMLQRLSALTILISAYELAHSSLFLRYSFSSFHTISTALAFKALVLSICLEVWATKVLRAEQQRTAFAEDLISGKWERFNILMFVTLLLRSAASLALIINYTLQRSIFQQRLNSYGVTFDQMSYLSAANTLNLMTTPIPLLELFMSLTFLKGAKTIFQYIKEPSKPVSRLIFNANTILMASSLGLVFSVLRLQGFRYNFDLPSLLNLDNLTGLLTIGSLSALLTLFTWLTTSRRWRVPSMITTSLLVILTFGLAIFTGNVYRHTINIQKQYEDTSDMKVWAERMGNVHENDLEAFGCPSKYLPGQYCKKPLLTDGWEAGPDNMSDRCLNVACAGLLGGLYSNPFLQISNFSLISLVSGLLVIIGGLYFWQRPWEFISTSGKRGYGWLALLLVMLIAFSGGLFFVKKLPFISERVPTPGFSPELIGLFETENQEDLLLTRNGLARKINDFFFLNKNRYLLMKLSPSNQIILEEEGGINLTYQDFVDKISSDGARFALLRTNLDEKSDKMKMKGIIWLPESSSQEEKERYVRKFGDGTLELTSLNLPILLAAKIEDLDEVKILSTYSVPKEDYGIYKEQIITKDRQDMATVLASNLNFTPYITPKDGFDLFSMLLFKSYKYIVLKINFIHLRLSIENKGDWSSTYDDFTSNFENGHSKLGLIYLDIEGEQKLVVVAFEDEATAQKRKAMLGEPRLPDLEEFSEMGIYFYLAHDIEDLKLENLIRGVTAQTKPEGELQYLLSVSETRNYQQALPLTSLWDSSSNLNIYQQHIQDNIQEMNEKVQAMFVGETGISIGGQVFKLIITKSHKYLIESYNKELGKVQVTSTGDWNTDYNTFLSNWNYDEPQVGFIHLDLDNYRKLAMIIYVPELYNLTETYRLFSLPKDPFRLENIGLKVILARNEEEMKLDSVLDQIYGDHAVLMQLMERTGIENTHQTRRLAGERRLQEETYKGNLLENEDIHKTLEDQIYKFVIFRKNPVGNSFYAAHRGVKDASSFKDFVDGFDKHQKQIGLMNLQLETINKFVLVAYTPNKEETFNEVLRDFGFEDSIEDFERVEVHVYLSHDKSDLKVKKFLKRIYSDIELVDELIENYELGDEFTNSCSCPRSIPNTIEQRMTDVSTNFIFGFGKMGLKLDSDIVKPLKAKKFKYIILHKDPQDKKPYIGSSGSWYATFDQFSREFEENKPQVGFIYLEVETLQKLVMVVYVPPDSELTEGQIIHDFGVTDKPNKLYKKGISIFVAHSMEDLTLENLMDSAYGPETTEITKLMALVEEYEAEPRCKLMNMLSRDEIINTRDEMTTLMINKLGLKLAKEWINILNDKHNKYVIFGLETKSVRKGDLHATFSQFAKDFDPVENQVGFFHMEFETERKLLMVLFAPGSEGEALEEIFERFDVAKKLSTLENFGVGVYVARNKDDLTLEKVLNHLFNYSSPEPELDSSLFVSETGVNLSSFTSPRELADVLNTKKYKYVIIKHDDAKNTNYIDSAGPWRATYNDFVDEFFKAQAQIGFVFLDLEAKEKLVMVIYSPNSSPSQVLSTFNFPQDTELLSKAGMNVYIAHNKKDLELFKVLTSIYSEPSPKIVSNEEEDLEAPAFITFNTWNSPYKVTMKTLLNKQYRYVIFKHDPVNPLNTLIITAPWDSVFDSFVSSFDEDQTQIGFVYLGEAGKEKLYAVILTPNSEDPSAVMIDFHLILDANGLKKFGIKDLRTFVANDKGDITIENLIAQSEENTQTLLYTERELPLGKDIVDAITNRKYKYLILKHDSKKDFTYVEKEGDWGSSYEDFVKDFTKKGGQLGLIYLDVEAKDMLVLIVYAPKLLGTQTLKEFGVSSDPEYLESLGIKPYIAHKKKDLELSKVLEGIHNEDAFYQNNPA